MTKPQTGHSPHAMWASKVDHGAMQESSLCGRQGKDGSRIHYGRKANPVQGSFLCSVSAWAGFFPHHMLVKWMGDSELLLAVTVSVSANLTRAIALWLPLWPCFLWVVQKAEKKLSTNVRFDCCWRGTSRTIKYNKELQWREKPSGS